MMLLDEKCTEKEKKHLEEIYEEEYAALVKSKETFNFVYWRNKDKLRYYDELLNELDIENRKNYLKIHDKMFLILAIFVSYYLTEMNQSRWIYTTLVGASFLYYFYFLIREMTVFVCIGHPFTNVSVFHKCLDHLISIKVESYEDIVKYHKLRIRMFALDRRQYTWKIIIVLFNMLFHLVIMATSACFLHTRVSHDIRTMYRDTVLLILFSVTAFIFSCIHLHICVDNWEWVLKLKPRLIGTVFQSSYLDV